MKVGEQGAMATPKNSKADLQLVLNHNSDRQALVKVKSENASEKLAQSLSKNRDWIDQQISKISEEHKKMHASPLGLKGAIHLQNNNGGAKFSHSAHDKLIKYAKSQQQPSQESSGMQLIEKKEDKYQSDPILDRFQQE